MRPRSAGFLTCSAGPFQVFSIAGPTLRVPAVRRTGWETCPTDGFIVRRTKKLPLEQLAPYLLPEVPHGTPAPPIVWRDLFGNDNPVEVEVGFGKGLHLVNAGAARPDTNFLGVEIVRKYQLYAATRLALRQLSNVRVASADGRSLLRD